MTADIKFNCSQLLEDKYDIHHFLPGAYSDRSVVYVLLCVSIIVGVGFTRL